MVVHFFVEAGFFLGYFLCLRVEMYSRKFGLRLHGKFGNLLKTRGLPGCNGLRSGRRGLGLCGTRGRPKFYETESSFRLAAETSRLAACAPRSVRISSSAGRTRTGL